jgi:hypothetical protein
MWQSIQPFAGFIGQTLVSEGAVDVWEVVGLRPEESAGVEAEWHVRHFDSYWDVVIAVAVW